MQYRIVSKSIRGTSSGGVNSGSGGSAVGETATAAVSEACEDVDRAAVTTAGDSYVKGSGCCLGRQRLTRLFLMEAPTTSLGRSGNRVGGVVGSNGCGRGAILQEEEEEDWGCAFSSKTAERF